jgi:hypothetical protein
MGRGAPWLKAQHLSNEIMVNDVRKFRRIDHLVKQAERHGIVLTDEKGEPLRYCPITVIEPLQSLGDVLDFSPEMIDLRLQAGAEAARVEIRSAPSNGQVIVQTVGDLKAPFPAATGVPKADLQRKRCS